MTEKDPLICQQCGHNMFRSRVKMDTMTVRCNKCKTVHEIVITFPKEKQKDLSSSSSEI